MGARKLVQVALVASVAGLLLGPLVHPSRASLASSIPAGPKLECGEQQVFGRPFRVNVLGAPIDCEKAIEIAHKPCGPHPKEEWSCYSIPDRGPFLAWFPTSQLFDDVWTTVIAFERYPCDMARFSPRLFKKAASGFPTRRQMLADDLFRCHLLRGHGPAGLRAMLGPPDRIFTRGRTRTFIYWLGPERDSYVLIDPEGLDVKFSGKRITSAFVFQG